MKKSVLLAAALAAASGSAVSAQEENRSLEFAGKTWRIAAREAAVTHHLGREAIAVNGGTVWLDEQNFSDGVIEFDIAYAEARSFIGVKWRAQSDERYEEIYVRAHLNEKPDAFQYTPVENGVSAWQIFSDANAQSAVNEKYGAWNHVRLVVVGDAADVYFNSEEPVLHVPDLKTDIAEGRVGLQAFGPSRETAYFSNLVIRSLRDGEKLIGAPAEAAPPPAGLIADWPVSSPFSEDLVANALVLEDNPSKALEWRALAVESNGIANLARLSGVEDGADTVFVRLRITSDRAQLKEMRFGYSDRVRIYLNGKRVYFGDAGYSVRDYRFLGTVGFFDSAGLDLKKGDNELLLAVSETFGGWAWAGAIADRTGIGLE